jgi:hypothetical protein
MRPYVRAAALSNYREVARRTGLDPTAMLEAAKLDPVVLDEPDRRIAAATVARLLENSAAQSGCDTFGLQMAEAWRLSDFGAVSLLLTHERTLRDALGAVIRYRHLLNDTVTISIEDAAPLVVIREELAGGTAARSRQAIELALGVIFRLCRVLLGAQWKPKSVRFTHPAPQALQVHRRIFGPVVEFDQAFNGIVCAAADLDRRNPSAIPRSRATRAATSTRFPAASAKARRWRRKCAARSTSCCLREAPRSSASRPSSARRRARCSATSIAPALPSPGS